MSADPIRDYYLAYLRTKELPAGHMAAWEWFRDRIPWYDHSAKIPSWKRAKRKDPRRPVAMAGFGAGVRTDDTKPTIASLRVVGSFPETGIAVSSGEIDPLEVASALFGTHTRQTSIVVPDGSAWVFDAIIRQCATAWVRAGWQVQPMVAGHAIKGLIVRQGRYRWTLADFEAMTATDPETAVAEAQAMGLARTTPGDGLRLLLGWVDRLAGTIHGELGTYLRPTVGGTAVRAAAYDLPDGITITRVQPLLVAMCRLAGGFRGGYVYGERYRGPGFKVDVRRMYAWALSQPLGWRWAIGPCVEAGLERDGIFLCTVSGTVSHPVQLPQWQGPADGFATSLWTGGETIAVLPSSEFAGLRVRCHTELGLRSVCGPAPVPDIPARQRKPGRTVCQAGREHAVRSAGGEPTPGRCRLQRRPAGGKGVPAGHAGWGAVGRVVARGDDPLHTKPASQHGGDGDGVRTLQAVPSDGWLGCRWSAGRPCPYGRSGGDG